MLDHVPYRFDGKQLLAKYLNEAVARLVSASFGFRQPSCRVYGDTVGIVNAYDMFMAATKEGRCFEMRKNHLTFGETSAKASLAPTQTTTFSGRHAVKLPTCLDHSEERCESTIARMSRFSKTRLSRSAVFWTTTFTMARAKVSARITWLGKSTRNAG